MNLLTDVTISKALAYAAGTADVSGEILDMQGHEGVICSVLFATIATAAVTSVKVESGDESDLSDAADITGASISVAADDDNQVFNIDIAKPPKRYLRVVIDKDATNSVAASALYIQYGPRTKPTDNTVTDKVTSILVVGG